MFTQRTECSKCGHYTVCGYKGRYRDFSNDIQKAAERGGLNERLKAAVGEIKKQKGLE